MKLIRLPEPQKLGPVSLRADETYVLEDSNAGYLLQYPDVDIRKFLVEQPRLDAASLLVSRPGGFGDLLFLTPALRALRAQRPELRLGVSAAEKYHDALAVFAERHRIELLPYPLKLGQWMQWDEHANLENQIEFGPGSRSLHAVDLFAKCIGVELTEGRHTEFTPAAAELDAMRARFPKHRPRVGIQLSASAPARSYPRHLFQPMVQGITDLGVEIVFIGTPGELNMASVPGQYLNLTSEKPSLTFAESCAVLADCDVVVAPDSAICHVAAAMGLPVVALYAAFPWQLRTAYQPTVRALTGQAPCAPCFHHSRGGHSFPEGAPCSRTGYCVAMANIDPQRIVAEVKKRF
jgi:ADP-heptose:LPS heptosyltransferase